MAERVQADGSVRLADGTVARLYRSCTSGSIVVDRRVGAGRSGELSKEYTVLLAASKDAHSLAFKRKRAYSFRQ